MSAIAEPHHWHQVPQAPAPGTVLGQRDALADGVPQMLALGLDDATHKPFRYLLLRSGDAVTAYVNRCAHFGVPLAAKQEQLRYVAHTSISCNVHYARYRWADGVCDRGECLGEALLAIPVTVDTSGRICIAEGNAA